MLENVIQRAKELNEEIELLRLWLKAAESQSEYNEARQAIQELEDELLLIGVLD